MKFCVEKTYEMGQDYQCNNSLTVCTLNDALDFLTAL